VITADTEHIAQVPGLFVEAAERVAADAEIVRDTDRGAHDEVDYQVIAEKPAGRNW
jgi:hypothetical protein